MKALILNSALSKVSKETRNPEVLVEVDGKIYPIKQVIGDGQNAFVLLAEDEGTLVEDLAGPKQPI